MTRKNVLINESKSQSLRKDRKSHGIKKISKKISTLLDYTDRQEHSNREIASPLLTILKALKPHSI
jgi:hypothetical protein